MAIIKEPTKWTMALGTSADANTIPDTSSTGTGAASMNEIFPAITQVPLSAGGVAPSRQDFNGLFKLLGDSIYYLQHGGVFSYSDQHDYDVGAIVLHEGKIYIAKAVNGVSSTVKDPSNSSAWSQLSSIDDIKALNFVSVSGSQTITGAKDFTGGLTVNGQPINGIPTGTIIPFAGSTIPTGYLLCNGSAVSRTSYASLFKVISTLYGAGDGSTTFNLPDLRDRFLEGAGTNAVGKYLEAGLPNIIGEADGICVINTNTTGAFSWKSLSTSNSIGTNAYMHINGLILNASSSDALYSKSTTVQVNALNIQYLIKY